jgi:hypothetical protein
LASVEKELQQMKMDTAALTCYINARMKKEEERRKEDAHKKTEEDARKKVEESQSSKGIFPPSS